METADLINEDLSNIKNWANNWLVTFYAPKKKSFIISNINDANLHPAVQINGIFIDEVLHHTYLGLKFANNLKWNHHINDIAIKARKRLNLMIPLKFKLNSKSVEIMYKSVVLPSMEYATVVWREAHMSVIFQNWKRFMWMAWG